MKIYPGRIALVSCSIAMLTSGCGGSATNATIGGTVSGLLNTNTVVALTNNLADPILLDANGTFAFDIPVQSGSAYNVAIRSQPVGETCTVTNGSGTIDQNGDAVSNIIVACTPN